MIGGHLTYAGAKLFLTFAEHFSSSSEFSVEISADPSEPCPESERVLISNLGSFLVSVVLPSSSLYWRYRVRRIRAPG